MRHSFLAGLAGLLFVALHSTALADDAALCRAASGTIDDRIAACSRAIESRTLSGQTLANVLNMRGNLYSNRSDFDRALSDYNEALRLNPNSAAILTNRGMSHSNKKDHDRAISDFDDAIRIDPKYAQAFAERGYAYDAKGLLDRAIEDFSEALKLQPKNAQTLRNRGTSYFDKKEFDRAISDLTDSVALDPKNAIAHNNLGAAYNAKKDYDRAISNLNKAIELDPKYTDALYFRGVAHREKKDYRASLADFEAILRIDPAYPGAIRNRDSVIVLANAAPVVSPKPAEVKPPTGKRVALVMGNGNYQHVPKLDNPIVDARTMRATLEKLGFEVVYGENLDRRAMGRHIGEFGAIVRDAEAAIVYFAGHGSTFGDIPYVVPVDSRYEKLSDIPTELIQVETLVSELRRAKGVRLVILDACRDNEREVELRRQDAAARGQATRGGVVSRGLARLQNPDGLIVVYSTQHMTTASDGNPGSNSPFTGALAKHLTSPGLDIKDVLFRAGQEVISQTGGTQRPEISISLYDPFVLAR